MKSSELLKGVIPMQEVKAGEVVHLFEIMKKHGATCSLEFQSDGTMDPLFGFSNQPVNLIEYFERKDGPDSVLVELGDASFNFELGVNTFMKDISENQIFICFGSDRYSAWFNSGHIAPDGIEDARNYREVDPERQSIELLPVFEEICSSWNPELLQSTLTDLEQNPETLKSLRTEFRNEIIAVVRRQLDKKLSQTIVANL